jgi:chaperonin GroEL
MKKIIFEKEAREKLFKGVEIMYKAVATTLSPKGRNVAIAKQWGLPTVVHDGVTVARDVEDKDEFVNMGINLVREAANKTNEEAGDGTTTSTLLTYHLVKYGMKLLDEGVNPMVLRKQMEEALPSLIEELRKISTITDFAEDIHKVAYISSQDEEIGKLVAEAVNKVGTNGLVTVEESPTPDIYITYTEGLQIDKGYTSPYFITNADRMDVTIESPTIAVIGKKITTQREIIPLLEVMVKLSKNLVLVGDISGEALRICIENKLKGVVSMLVVDVPGFSDHRARVMDDIAAMVGGKVITDELGLGMEEFAQMFDKDWLGNADNIVSTKHKTIIIGGKGDATEVADKIKQIKSQIETSDSIYDKEKLEERLAKVTTGVAVVRVGGKTEIEQREKVERVKDAIGAARAALDEGIVPGGGVAFLRIREAINKGDDTNNGESILYYTLEEPLRKILINSGESDDAINKIIDRVRSRKGNVGYNVSTGEVEDMLESGIIDPAKVIRLSLENAVSVAGSILSTDCLIVEELESTKDGQ